MANGKKGLLDFFKMDDDDDYEDDDDSIFEEDEEEDEAYKPSFRKKAEKAKARDKAVQRNSFSQPPVNNSFSAQPQASSYNPTPAVKPQKKFSSHTATDRVVNFEPSIERRPRSGFGEVYVIKPNAFDDAQEVVDFLKSGKAIVINMEGLQVDSAQRIIDFIGGAVYGMSGELKAISSSIFIAAPNSIELSGDFKDELLNNSSLSPMLGE